MMPMMMAAMRLPIIRVLLELAWSPCHTPWGSPASASDRNSSPGVHIGTFLAGSPARRGPLSSSARTDRPRPRVRLLPLSPAARPDALPALEVGALARPAAARLGLAAEPSRRRAPPAPPRGRVRPPAVRPAGPAARPARRGGRPATGELGARRHRAHHRVARAALARAPGRRLFVALEAVADQPEHRRPQADEQRAPLRVAALVLIDRLGADPQRDAEPDAPERGGVEGPAGEAGVMDRLRDHGRRATRVARPHASPSLAAPAPRHGHPLAGGRRPDVVELHVAHHAAAPRRGGGPGRRHRPRPATAARRRGPG